MTFVEVLVVLAVLALLFTLGLSALQNFSRETSLQGETQRLAAFIKEAHDRALSSLDRSGFGVHFEGDSVTLFKGDTYSQGAVTNEIFEWADTLEVSHDLEGGGDDVVFTKIKGTGRNGTVTVTSQNGAKIIDLFETGIVKIR